jgi:hypothetical protein
VDPKAATSIPEAGGRSLERRWVTSQEANLALALERSARLSQRLGDEAAKPRRRKAPSLAAHLACGLYRRSAYCSLRALSLLPSGASSEVPSAEALDDGHSSFTAVFLGAPKSALVSAAGGAERLSALEQRLCADTFVDFADREPSEAAALAKDLGAFARGLIRELELSRGRVDRKAAVPSLRWVLGAFLAITLITFCLVMPDVWAARRDLAVGKPWAASSVWGGGCESPLQECPGDGNYFVHTQPENEPWFELDLLSAQTISGAQVVNRLDCCTERAVPLVLEVSTDHKKWREVIRSTQPFREWKPSFAKVSARWVRLRIPKYGTLHLKRVRILP